MKMRVHVDLIVLPTVKPDQWHHDLLSLSVSLSSNWAIHPNSAERPTRNRQVSILEELGFTRRFKFKDWVLVKRLSCMYGYIYAHIYEYFFSKTWTPNLTLQHRFFDWHLTPFVKDLFICLRVRIPVESKQLLNNPYLSLPSQVLGIIWIWDGLVGTE